MRTKANLCGRNIMYIILGTGKGDRKTGYIAESFLEEATSRGIDCICLSRKSIDYTDYKTFSEYIDNYWKTFSKDTVVINCAGYTGKPNVDACELNKDQAILGNIVLPTMLSEVCESRELPFVHISSGCIYNGDDKHFSEDDEPNFTFNTGSFYSGTKELAERSIKSNSSSYIFRLRIPFDQYSSPRNYITKLLTYETLVDATNSLSHRGDFAKYCIDLIEGSAPFGIYNVTNRGGITTREVVDLIKYHLIDNYVPVIAHKEFKFFEDYEAFEGVIKTPRSNCVLDTSKIEKYVPIRSVKDALSDALSQYTIT